MEYTPKLSDIPKNEDEGYTPTLADIPSDSPGSSLGSFFSKILPNLNTGEPALASSLIALNTMHNNLRNAPKNIINEFSPNLANKIDEYHGTDLDKLIPASTLSDKVIRGLVQQSPAFLMPELNLGRAGEALEGLRYGGKTLKSVISRGIPISAYEATQSGHPAKSAEETFGAVTPFNILSSLVKSTNPLVGMAARAGAATLGGLSGYEGAQSLGADTWNSKAVAAVLGALAGGIPGNPKLQARDEMLAGVNPEIAMPKIEAAKRLGLSYVTPGEVGGNPYTAGMQGTVGKKEGGQLLYEKGKERLQSEENAINVLKNTIYDPEKQDPIKKALYKDAYSKSEPQEFIDNLKESAVMKEAFKKVSSEPAYQDELKDIPETSYAYLDQVNRALNDMHSAAERIGEGNKARIIKNKQKEMLNTLDTNNPSFEDARALAERQITRRDTVEEALNTGNMTGTNFFRRLLQNSDKFNKLRNNLRNVPEAQQQLDDMRLVFGDLINPPTNRTQAGLVRAGMNQNRNTKTDFLSTLKEFFSGNQLDKAKIELITNPNWHEELKNVGKISDLRNKIAASINLIGRASGAAVGQQNARHKPIEFENEGNQ